MDDKLMKELKIKEVQKMKNPTILMNETDFEGFKMEIETKTNIKVNRNSTYKGIPIKTNNSVQRGNIIIYDDVYHNWL